jgi:hypothetical protein
MYPIHPCGCDELALPSVRQPLQRPNEHRRSSRQRSPAQHASLRPPQGLQVRPTMPVHTRSPLHMSPAQQGCPESPHAMQVGLPRIGVSHVAPGPQLLLAQQG